MRIRSRWHGDDRYIGLHYDLHGNRDDTELGTRARPEELVPMLEVMAPDFVQTDCKGHPGYVSWFSETPDASVPPELREDALAQWREATRRLGLPLHCHYSGLWDGAAGEKHPEWAVKSADGESAGAPFGPDGGSKADHIMCPRGAYVDELLIPQFAELIDRYQVDGFWVDGEIWAAKPCYCERCVSAWKEESGESDAPVDTEDPRWPAWMAFVRRSFEAYVSKYCEAVHEHKPDVLVCSNWLQTFKNPGAPVVPTDWISGDNSWVYGLDQSRCEARFLSTRKKHWDIMLWAFYSSHGLGNAQSPMTFKPPQMLMQEAAVLAAFGGNVQIYEHPPVRDGRLVPWRQRRLREVVRFIRARKALCRDSDTIPQIAVLHSEHHLYGTISGPNLLWNVDTKPVEGAAYALLENHFGVDILDEWALAERIDEFPVVVVPEQHQLSEEMVARLKTYVEQGGHLIATGADLLDRFGPEFIGARIVAESTDESIALESGDGDVPVYSRRWGELELHGAEPILRAWNDTRLDDRERTAPGAVCNRVGRGVVVSVAGDLFRYFAVNRYPEVRKIAGRLVEALDAELSIRVEAPTAVDVAFRRKKIDGIDYTVIHLMNRSSGIPNQPENGAIDEIPSVGPITISIEAESPPATVYRAFEEGGISTRYDGARLTIVLQHVGIHEAVVIG